jgi:hypothetical protein
VFFPIDYVCPLFSYFVGSPLRYGVPVRVISLYTDAYSHELLLLTNIRGAEVFVGMYSSEGG